MATTNIILDVKDSFISATNPTLNFGKESALYTGSIGATPGDDHKALLYFDISSIPANATITAATLNLFVFRDDNVASVNVTLTQLDSDWLEYKVTNANAPTSSALVAGDTSVKAIIPGNVGTIISLSGLINTTTAWYLDGNTNHGFEISGPAIANSTIGFWSREYSEIDSRPTLQIEYNVTSDIPDIVTTVIPQQILPIQAGALTTIYDTSNNLTFNYLVQNDQIDFVYATPNASDTRTGTFISIGNEIPVAPGTNSVIEIATTKRFVALSVRGTDFPNPINAQASYKTFANMVTPIVLTGIVPVLGTPMGLTMTKPLIGTTADPLAFTITSTGTAPTVTSATVSGLTVSLVLSAAILTGQTITLTYTATGLNDLTGSNGLVNNFTNIAITNNSTQV